MKSNPQASRDYWNKDDLRVYIFLYCANADLVLKEGEQAYINEKIDSAKYKDILEEFDTDNDYQSIKKIEESIGHLGYTKDQLDSLLLEIKELFWADGEYDNIERAIMRRLKHILKI